MNTVREVLATRAMVPGRIRRYGWLITLLFWLYVMIILAGHLAGFPLSYSLLHRVCAKDCAGLIPLPQLTPENAHVLSSIGLSIAWYVSVYTALQVLYVLACIGVAVFIVLKKPGERIPVATGFLLVGMSAYEGANYPAIMASYPFLAIPLYLLILLGVPLCGSYVLLTFPNGRFAPRWVFLAFLVIVIDGFLPTSTPNGFLTLVLNIVSFVAGFPLVLFILIYRFRSVLSAKERNATKWVIYSLSIFILLVLLAFVVLPTVAPADSLWFLLVNTMGFFGCGINIMGLFIAIFYANAFDIDVLIKRTLVYGGLSSFLGALYAGLVIGMEGLASAMTGGKTSEQPIALVVSTLLIAALFQPVRKRIQAIIDRRFYRRKYDAEKTLTAFSTTLRNQVDLNELHEHLLTVVQETMQPSHVSLWLRPQQRPERQPL